MLFLTGVTHKQVESHDVHSIGFSGMQQILRNLYHPSPYESFRLTHDRVSIRSRRHRRPDIFAVVHSASSHPKLETGGARRTEKPHVLGRPA